MPAAKFTDMFIRNLKPKGKLYQVRETSEYREESGFGIRVFPNGLKHWIFAYRNNGKRRTMTLGHYPGMSLADARAEFQKVRIMARKELIDPISARQAKNDSRQNIKEEDQKALTISKLISEYIERHAKRFKRSWKEDQRILNHDVIPVWGKRMVVDIKRRDINLLLEQIIERGAPVMANNTFKIIRKMFNWAVKNDYLDVSPALNIDLPTPKVDRNRVLSEQEIRIFWKSIDSADMSNEIRRALKLILVTAQRPNEVIGMRSEEIDGCWWIIPVLRQKVAKSKESERNSHRVYLTDLALELIGDLDVFNEETGKKERKEYIFPCPHKKKIKSINRTAMSKAIVNNCPSNCIYDCDKCDIAKCKNSPGPLSDKNKIGVKHFTPHDLRRTAATIMAKSGTSDEVIDAVLNHVKYGVIKIYNQYKYDTQKKKSLTALSKKITGIVK